ncbi:C40 family peptidase [Streptomyces zingiberis]|uniref:Glycoside hydrolase n=1 Tax=Streptomyces zingiberis TaxID=2053010 RepID=A0ABX1C2L8_9ACTN|nr:C40 family peptidase [Streptomyces zingiberis]NJQ02930.1 glycoside hydrolase [Streptomyces zingiberis]
MSHSAHIPRHRKPRRNAPVKVLRSGIAGGVLSTIAVTAAASSANAAPATQTAEMPTISAAFAEDVAASTAATQQAALELEIAGERAALASAEKKAEKKARAQAERTAEAERKAERAAERRAEAARQAAAERSDRSQERTTLSAPSTAPSATPGAGSAATGSAASVVEFVKAQVGKAYVSGATGPSAYDCSGLTSAAFRTVGVSLPRVSGDQSTAGTPVSLGSLQPGDILYWGSAGSAYHVAVYIGDGKWVGAQNPSTGVVERDLDWDPPTGAVRVL